MLTRLVLLRHLVLGTTVVLGTWYYCGTSSSEQLVLWLFVWLCNVLPAFVGGHVCFIHSWVQDPPGCLT